METINRYAVKPPITIASGQNLSGAIDIEWAAGIGIELPAAWDGNTISFAVSSDIAGTYGPLKSGGAEYTESVVAGDRISIDISAMFPWRYIKIRSGTSSTPTNQTADRSIKIVCRV